MKGKGYDIWTIWLFLLVGIAAVMGLVAIGQRNPGAALVLVLILLGGWLTLLYNSTTPDRPKVRERRSTAWPKRPRVGGERKPPT